jgi:hypothetical protein
VNWTWGSVLWLAAYLSMLAIVAAGVVRGRSAALAVYGTPQAQTQWDAWRTETKKLAEQPGVVKRREAKSVEPPALVLMRDYFVVCLAGALLLSSILFATFMVFIRGAMSAPTRLPHSRD